MDNIYDFDFIRKRQEEFFTKKMEQKKIKRKKDFILLKEKTYREIINHKESRITYDKVGRCVAGFYLMKGFYVKKNDYIISVKLRENDKRRSLI